MKRSPRRIAVFVAIVVALCAPIACGNGTEDAGAENRPTTTTDHSAHGAEAKADARVEMSLIAYRPPELAVAASTTVTWTQNDAGTHTVTSGTVAKQASGAVKTNPSGRFESGELERGETFEFTFDEPGSYEYFCDIHPATMQGRITVE